MNGSELGNYAAKSVALIFVAGLCAGAAVGAVLFKLIPWLWQHISVRWIS